MYRNLKHQLQSTNALFGIFFFSHTCDLFIVNSNLYLISTILYYDVVTIDPLNHNYCTVYMTPVHHIMQITKSALYRTYCNVQRPDLMKLQSYSNYDSYTFLFVFSTIAAFFPRSPTRSISVFHTMHKIPYH